MTSATQRGVIPILSDAQRLAVAREYVGLTQAELAERLGVTTATVQRAESGKTKPRRTTFMSWAMATGIDLHWLETGETPADPDGPDGGEGGESAPSRARTYDLRITRPSVSVLSFRQSEGVAA